MKLRDKTATRPLTANTMAQDPVSRIARRTRGQSYGPITRLMLPSDFGRLLKPFVFLDLIDNQGKPFSGFGLHPHSGIATVTYIAQGSVSYEDTNGATGLVARRRRLAWWRTRRAGTDAGLPALDCLASRTRAGNIGERLSFTGSHSPRWAGANPPRHLRNCDKRDQSLVADGAPELTGALEAALILSAG